jgi:hypothetical protein
MSINVILIVILLGLLVLNQTSEIEKSVNKRDIMGLPYPSPNGFQIKFSQRRREKMMLLTVSSADATWDLKPQLCSLCFLCRHCNEHATWLATVLIA